MPIYDIICRVCNYQGEVLLLRNSETPLCPACGSMQTERLISATSSLTGHQSQAVPVPGDTTCCGQSPGKTAGCSGPGSCCGKRI